MRKKIVTLDNYLAESDGRPTFAGVLNNFHGEIFWRCNDETKNKYNAAYNAHILPLLGNRFMDTLTLEDCELAMEAINAKQQYESATLAYFRYLITAVVRCAQRHGLCDDILFGTAFAAPEKAADEPKKRLIRNKKSFTAREEAGLFERTLRDPEQDGTRMGLGLMFATGLRNGEACAALFEDFRPLECDPTVHSFWMARSCVGETAEDKAGGKTPNAPRKIPVPPYLIAFLEKRKQYLRCLAEEGKLILPEGKTVEKLPVVCKKDFISHCTSEELGAAGRVVLKEIGVDEEMVAEVDRELRGTDVLKEMGVQEKDPTAYLLRRNFATQLHILHLTETEIEYLMGHQIQEKYVTRNEYSSEEHQLHMAQKLAHRPLFNELPPVHTETVITAEQPNVSNADTHTFTIHTDGKQKGTLYIEARVLEPSDSISVEVTAGSSDIEGEYRLMPIAQAPTQTINILREYQQLYEKVSAPKRRK